MDEPRLSTAGISSTADAVASRGAFGANPMPPRADQKFLDKDPSKTAFSSGDNFAVAAELAPAEVSAEDE